MNYENIPCHPVFSRDLVKINEETSGNRGRRSHARIGQAALPAIRWIISQGLGTINCRTSMEGKRCGRSIVGRKFKNAFYAA